LIINGFFLSKKEAFN